MILPSTSDTDPAHNADASESLSARENSENVENKSAGSTLPMPPTDSIATKPQLTKVVEPTNEFSKLRRSTRTVINKGPKKNSTSGPVRCIVTSDGFGRHRVVEILNDSAAKPVLIGDEKIVNAYIGQHGITVLRETKK